MLIPVTISIHRSRDTPVRALRTEALLLPAAVALLVSLLSLTGCSTPGVGDPCVPEQIPAGGFDQTEAYIESSSVQCETRVCMVWHLQGTPDGAPGCNLPGSNCVTEDETKPLWYCTCRCDSGDSRFAACTCPSDYTCTSVLEQGSEGVRGSYCVHNNTVNL